MLRKAILGLLTGIVAACGQADRPPSEAQQLAQTHCSSCHAFPEPSLLDQTTWAQRVLPQMALRMGVAPNNTHDPSIQQAYFHLSEAGLYPRPARVSPEDWEKIRQFYESQAPDSLPIITDSLPVTSQFVARVPDRTLPPAVTYVHFHQQTQQMWVADHTQGQVVAINSDGKAHAVLSQRKLVSHMQELPATAPHQLRLLVTYLGEDIRPADPASGEVAEVILSEGKAPRYMPLDLPPLPRPTQALYADLAGDTLPELLTANFGYLTGRLSYWSQSKDGTYQEHVIRNEVGALRVIPQDVTGDGRTDLLVLWAQGDERLALYKNNGDGTFDEHVLLRFLPSYGSSYFELADVDQDGLQDVLYTCGDNADHSPVLKPYHGVYVFRNQGDFRLEHRYFFPINGAYRAIARDFDQDGDTDIAAVSFFADYAHRPEEGFVYLEQQEAFQFRASTVPVHHLGRWITLDAGDLDRDGDLDLVLGNCATAGGFDRTLDRHWKEGPPYVVLENRTE